MPPPILKLSRTITGGPCRYSVQQFIQLPHTVSFLNPIYCWFHLKEKWSVPLLHSQFDSKRCLSQAISSTALLDHNGKNEIRLEEAFTALSSKEKQLMSHHSPRVGGKSTVMFFSNNLFNWSWTSFSPSVCLKGPGLLKVLVTLTYKRPSVVTIPLVDTHWLKHRSYPGKFSFFTNKTAF